MTSLTNQRDARKLRDIKFCYLCGKQFKEGDKINGDHVPPKTIFKNDDRNFPIKLPTHKDECHSSLNLEDDVIGQLIGLLHGKQVAEKNDKLKLKMHKTMLVGHSLTFFSGESIELLLRRWIRGFHAALYLEPLDINTNYAIQTPFPHGEKVNGKIVFPAIKPQHYNFVECIKRNRLAGKLDVISCNNNKLRYECVWDKLNNGQWSCIFALNVYDWKDLGDVNNFKPRGCAGIYTPDNGKLPDTASTATQFDFAFANYDKADPFSL